MCHGSDGAGARGFPNLTDNDWLYGGSFDTIMQTLDEVLLPGSMLPDIVPIFGSINMIGGECDR